MLFVTSTCPNCRIVKPLLDKAGMICSVLDVAENKELAQQYNLKQAPTLIVQNSKNVSSYEGVAQIKAYIKECTA